MTTPLPVPSGLHTLAAAVLSLLVCCSASVAYCAQHSPFAAADTAANPLGFDMGWSPEKTERTLRALGLDARDGQWLRVRGMAGSTVLAAPEDGSRRTAHGGQRTRDGSNGSDLSASPEIDPRVVEKREALAQLRSRGHKIVAMLRWGSGSWQSGVRSPRGHFPFDLTEVFERCQDLAFTYGDLIDAWEIDNEPDISFVPENAETFAAFYKASALGVVAGREAAERYEGGKVKGKRLGPEDGEGWEGGKVKGDKVGPEKRANAKPDLLLDTWRSVTSAELAASAVMHSPMALPPGPYWEELVANDVLSYTEAFNYHYYGYAEDFRGVRDAWIAALNRALRVGKHESAAGKVDASKSEFNLELDTWNLELRSGRPALPVFLTEYGHGLLDRFDRHTLEGRERQKRFFELTLPSITDGTITGAMAFVFKPYYERGVNEFGLLADVPLERLPVAQTRQSGKVSDEPPKYRGGEPKADLRRFTSEDLSPVVIDFIAGENTQSVKRYNGHLLQRAKAAAADVEGLKSTVEGQADATAEVSTSQFSRVSSVSAGEFTLVVYNFSDEPVIGKLSISLENGQVGALLDDARATPEAKTDSSWNAPRPSTSRPSTQAAASKPQPYVRPDVPRSSLRPPTEPDWPNADTRIVTTAAGKSYAVTPALKFLRNAAQELVERRMSNDEGLNWQPSNPTQPTKTGTASATATNGEHSTVETGLTETGYSDTLIAHSNPSLLVGDAKTFSPSHLQRSIHSTELTLQPMERRELKFTATLANRNFSPHRLLASFEPFCGNNNSTLATQLYPSPSAFRLQTIDTFDFTAQDNAEARARQLARPRAEGEAKLYQNPSAERWLSTPGIEIEETLTGWRITVNDLPPEPLRPAEIELPLPEDWAFPANAALSLQYRLVLPDPKAEKLKTERLKTDSAVAGTSGAQTTNNLPNDSVTAPNRFEEFDVNFRDNDGTLWSVWPRLFAKKATQSYLEPVANFTPMFFSRAANKSRLSLGGGESLVLMVRPRVLPTTIEVQNIQATFLDFK